MAWIGPSRGWLGFGARRGGLPIALSTTLKALAAFDGWWEIYDPTDPETRTLDEGIVTHLAGGLGNGPTIINTTGDRPSLVVNAFGALDALEAETGTPNLFANVSPTIPEPYYVLAVARVSSLATVRAIFSVHSSAARAGIRVQANGSVAMRGAGGPTDIISDAGLVSLNTRGIFAGLFNGASSYLTLNKTQIAAGSINSGALNQITLLARGSNDTTWPFRGLVGPVLIYPGEPSAGVIDRMHAMIESHMLGFGGAEWLLASDYGVAADDGAQNTDLLAAIAAADAANKGLLLPSGTIYLSDGITATGLANRVNLGGQGTTIKRLDSTAGSSSRLIRIDGWQGSFKGVSLHDLVIDGNLTGNPTALTVTDATGFTTGEATTSTGTVLIRSIAGNTLMVELMAGTIESGATITQGAASTTTTMAMGINPNPQSHNVQIGSASDNADYVHVARVNSLGPRGDGLALPGNFDKTTVKDYKSPSTTHHSRTSLTFNGAWREGVCTRIELGKVMSCETSSARDWPSNSTLDIVDSVLERFSAPLEKNANDPTIVNINNSIISGALTAGNAIINVNGGVVRPKASCRLTKSAAADVGEINFIGAIFDIDLDAMTLTGADTGIFWATGANTVPPTTFLDYTITVVGTVTQEIPIFEFRRQNAYLRWTNGDLTLPAAMWPIQLELRNTGNDVGRAEVINNVFNWAPGSGLAAERRACILVERAHEAAGATDITGVLAEDNTVVGEHATLLVPHRVGTTIAMNYWMDGNVHAESSPLVLPATGLNIADLSFPPEGTGSAYRWVAIDFDPT